MALKSKIDKQQESIDRINRIFFILKMDPAEIVLTLEMLLNQYEESAQKSIQVRDDLQ